jgi:Predicted hydrolases or acyltransferases (alpha/beta hydrolase superfamily)
MRVYKSERGKAAVWASYDRLLSEWGIPVEERYIPTSYGRTHLVLAGKPESPPLLLFHGVGDDSALMWVFNARELAKRFRIMAVDTMGGVGKSEPNEAYDAGFDLSRWYGDILDALALRQTYAAGVSYGCYHCQLMAASYPDRVERFVGMSGFVSLAGATGSGLRTAARMAKLILPAVFSVTRKGVLRNAARIAGPGSGPMLANPAIAEHFVHITRQYRMSAQKNHTRRGLDEAELEIIKGKGLFLIGEEDALVDAAAAARLNAELGLRLKLFKCAGHALNHALPRQIEAEMVDFCLGTRSAAPENATSRVGTA